MLEAKFEAERLTDLSNFSLAQLYQMATELIQNHCKNQELKKHIKKIKNTSLSKYCNEKPNKFGCHGSDTLSSYQKRFHIKQKES